MASVRVSNSFTVPELRMACQAVGRLATKGMRAEAERLYSKFDRMRAKAWGAMEERRNEERDGDGSDGVRVPNSFSESDLSIMSQALEAFPRRKLDDAGKEALGALWDKLQSMQARARSSKD